jgi:hypothetical protein
MGSNRSGTRRRLRLRRRKREEERLARMHAAAPTEGKSGGLVQATGEKVKDALH